MTSLRQRLLEDMQVRNLSVHTQPSYVQQVSRFARHFDQSPEVLGHEEIRGYQVYLTNERKLAPSSITIAVSALRFVYKVTLKKAWPIDEVIPAPKKPQTLPVAPSPEEVVQFLECVKPPKHRTILTTCYAAGLRISEAIRLTIPVIDSRRMVIRVEQGKGQKDRYVMLSLLRPVPTSARSNYCSGIAVSRPPRAICASRPRRSARPRARSTCSPVPLRRPPRPLPSALLTARCQRLVVRGTAKPKVATAIARELTGFIWAMAHDVVSPAPSGTARSPDVFVHRWFRRHGGSVEHPRGRDGRQLRLRGPCRA